MCSLCQRLLFPGCLLIGPCALLTLLQVCHIALKGNDFSCCLLLDLLLFDYGFSIGQAVSQDDGQQHQSQSQALLVARPAQLYAAVSTIIYYHPLSTNSSVVLTADLQNPWHPATAAAGSEVLPDSNFHSKVSIFSALASASSTVSWRTSSSCWIRVFLSFCLNGVLKPLDPGWTLIGSPQCTKCSIRCSGAE